MSKLLIFLYVIATSAGLIVLKMGSKNSAPVEIINNQIHFNINPYTIVGVLLYGLSFFMYVYLISKHDLGYIIPLTTALVYILIFTASFFIFRESFTSIKIVGICLILAGVIFLNWK